MKKFLLGSVIATALLAGVANAKEYNIDKSHSDVGFKIKHLQISNVKGNFKDYSGMIDFEGGEFKKLEASIKVASVNTENTARDKHLAQDDFFKAKAHPEMTFSMKKYEKISDDKGRVTGMLNMAGVSREITLDAEIGGIGKGMKGEERLGFSLNGAIKRSDFKFAPDTSSVTLGDEVKLNIEIEAVAK